VTAAQALHISARDTVQLITCEHMTARQQIFSNTSVHVQSQTTYQLTINICTNIWKACMVT